MTRVDLGASVAVTDEQAVASAWRNLGHHNDGRVGLVEMIVDLADRAINTIPGVHTIGAGGERTEADR